MNKIKTRVIKILKFLAFEFKSSKFSGKVLKKVIIYIYICGVQNKVFDTETKKKKLS